METKHSMPADILIVDDERDIRTQLAGILSDEGYSTRAVGTAQEALAEAVRKRPNLMILDVWLEGSKMDGLGILQQIKQQQPETPVVMISGHGTIQMAVEATRLGADDFIEKPFDLDRLLLTISRALEVQQLRRENKQLKAAAPAAPELHGVSSAIQNIRNTLDKAASTASRVLIYGPAGAGKEMAVRYLHHHSKRHQAQLITLKCDLSDADFGTKLFGTDVDGTTTQGLLDQAEGGTLILNDVADLNNEAQGQLLKLLQGQTFRRIGGTTDLPYDVRIVATTAQNVPALVEAGTFRQDLFYRLNVVPIAIPPLRERQEDILPLIESNFALLAAQHNLLIPILAPDALVALQAYDWPGNVRQLRNVLEWLLIMRGTGGPIGARDLPAEVGSNTPQVLQWEHGAQIMGLPLRESRELFEKEYLLAQLSRHAGNISRTAQFIGMERSALHRKLKALGINSGEKAENDNDAEAESAAVVNN